MLWLRLRRLGCITCRPGMSYDEFNKRVQCQKQRSVIGHVHSNEAVALTTEVAVLYCL